MSADGNAWRRLEETVFQINDLSQRFWRRDGYSLGRENGETKTGEKVADLVLIMFDKASRTFNWVMVAPPLLEAAASGHSDKYAEEALGLVIGGLANKGAPDDFKASWERFEGRYSHKPFFAEHTELIRKIVNAYAALSPEDKDLPAVGSIKNVWTAIVMLYAHYPHPKDQNVEGIFFKILEEVGHSSPADVKDAVFGLKKGDKLDLTYWKSARRTLSTIEDLANFDGVKTIEDPDTENRYYSDDRVEEAAIVRKVLLDPLVMNYDFGEEKSFSKGIESHRFMLLAPVYDVWQSREGWGGLQAVLVILTNEPKSKNVSSSVIGNPEWDDHYQRLLDRCGDFANEITQAATRRALARPIKPPYDLVRHFLHILVEVQDWEEAIVFYDGIPHYLFKRHTYEWREEEKVKKYKRVREAWGEYEIRKNGDGYEYEFPEWPKDKNGKEDEAAIKQVRGWRPLTVPNEQCGGLDTSTDGFCMWWTTRDKNSWTRDKNSCQDLWSKAVLSGLSDEERAVVGGTSICFKFPKACRIPPKDETASREVLVESYRRQQLELMRRLIPKVRARRAALRNAVSAIMGRNMSHNIGSHVLARYATAITDAVPNDGSKVDARTDFVSYLQKRMDFLAEIGTSDQAFWSQPLVLGSELARLNLEKEKDRLAGEPPLLRYITGKDQLVANVTFVGDSDLLFSCPGGKVGAHALYVILENMIRNSARHNDLGSGAATIEVVADTPENGYIELHIRDLQTKLREDGCRNSAGSALDRGWEFTTGPLLRTKIREAREDRKTADAECRPVKPEIVPDEINYIIEFEPIIDDDGRPNPKYWGIREMHVCAQYLRQLLLSDMEDVPWSDRDPEVTKRPVIHAECEKSTNGDYCLSYVIYLEEAKLLATIEYDKANQDIEFKPKNGFVRVQLGSSALQEFVRTQSSSNLVNVRKALDEISNYAFIAIDPDPTVKDWVGRHAWELPLRRLEGIPDLSQKKDTRSVLEFLYSTLAGQVQIAQTSPVGHENSNDLKLGAPAGLVLAKDAQLNAKADYPGFSGGQNAPVAVQRDPNNRVWEGWVESKTWVNDAPVYKIDAFFWLDHPTRDSIKTYREINVGGFLNSIYFEPIFSHSPATEVICGLQSGEGWELIAAAQPRIVVLDERVQAAAGNKVRDTLTAEECWPGMRIEVPNRDDEANLDSPNFDRCRCYLKTRQNKIDYLILHLTILERLSAQCKHEQDIFATIDALKQETKAETAAIMIVTGRGVSTFARSGSARGRRERYLPVSALLEYLTQRPSKLGLMRALWSASNPKEKN
jgi:hypothetical protein